MTAPAVTLSPADAAAALPPLHPLIARLVTGFGATRVTRDTLADWEAEPGTSALLFAGDPVRFPEGLDVAVVLPELQAAFGHRFRLGVVPRDDEDAIARRFGSQRWPSVVFLRDGGWLGTVCGMQDWPDFLAAVGDVLDREPGRAPTVGIPVVAAGAASSACA